VLTLVLNRCLQIRVELPPRVVATPVHRDRYSGLDTLRLVAASAVFLQHIQDHFVRQVHLIVAAFGPTVGAYAASLLHHAHVGVDLFFVLSGCSLGLYAERYSNREQALPFRAYAVSRTLRLYPAFFFALLIAVAARPSLWHFASLRPLLLNALLVGSYLPPGSMVLNASWSLTTEAIFYCMFPLLAAQLLLPRANKAAVRRAWGLGALLVLGALSLRALSHYLALAQVHGPSFALELTQRRLAPCRLDQFLWGIGCARMLTWSPLPAAACKWVLGGCICVLLVVVPLEGELYYTPYGAIAYMAFGPAFAGIVVACAGGRPGWLSALGERSYGFFLYHEVVIGLVLALATRLGLGGPEHASTFALCALVIVAYALSLAAGALSFATIERWARTRTRRLV
jgi:peptidoglycan/LPS O-acetylase OafA/YrhL